MPDNNILTPAAKSNPMQLSLLDWKSLPRNSLRGFATVRLGRSMKISDVAVHCNNGKRWASLPSKPMVGRDNNTVKDDRGKLKYVPLIEWLDREAADRFSEAVIQAVEAAYPGQTAGDYAP